MLSSFILAKKKSKYEEGYTCKIDPLVCTECNEVFAGPRTLNCGHTFCKGCVSSHIKKCPLCQTEITSKNPSQIIEDLIQERLEKTKEVWGFPEKPFKESPTDVWGKSISKSFEEHSKDDRIQLKKGKSHKSRFEKTKEAWEFLGEPSLEVWEDPILKPLETHSKDARIGLRKGKHHQKTKISEESLKRMKKLQETFFEEAISKKKLEKSPEKSMKKSPNQIFKKKIEGDSKSERILEKVKEISLLESLESPTKEDKIRLRKAKSQLESIQKSRKAKKSVGPIDLFDSDGDLIQFESSSKSSSESSNVSFDESANESSNEVTIDFESHSNFDSVTTFIGDTFDYKLQDDSTIIVPKSENIGFRVTDPLQRKKIFVAAPTFEKLKEKGMEINKNNFLRSHLCSVHVHYLSSSSVGVIHG